MLLLHSLVICCDGYQYLSINNFKVLYYLRGNTLYAVTIFIKYDYDFIYKTLINDSNISETEDKYMLLDASIG